MKMMLFIVTYLRSWRVLLPIRMFHHTGQALLLSGGKIGVAFDNRAFHSDAVPVKLMALWFSYAISLLFSPVDCGPAPLYGLNTMFT